jgi:hypothetical protein
MGIQTVRITDVVYEVSLYGLEVGILCARSARKVIGPSIFRRNNVLIVASQNLNTCDCYLLRTLKDVVMLTFYIHSKNCTTLFKENSPVFKTGAVICRNNFSEGARRAWKRERGGGVFAWRLWNKVSWTAREKCSLNFCLMLVSFATKLPLQQPCSGHNMWDALTNNLVKRSFTMISVPPFLGAFARFGLRDIYVLHVCPSFSFDNFTIS